MQRLPYPSFRTAASRAHPGPHRLRRLASVALVAAFAAAAAVPAAASPDGKTTTAEISSGAGALYYLYRLTSDNRKADATGRDADQLFDSKFASVRSIVPTKAAEELARSRGIALPAKTTVTVSISMRQARLNVLNDLMAANTNDPSLRKAYETFRACWNAFVFAAKADATNTKGETCEKGAAIPAGIDETDLQAALDAAPTTYQQVLDQRLGTYTDENQMRANFYAVYGDSLDLLINPSRGQVHNLDASTATSTTGSINVSDLVKNCATALDLLGCIGSLGAAESTAAANRRLDVACDVARRMWFPSLTTVKRVRKANGDRDFDERALFGAVPGC